MKEYIQALDKKFSEYAEIERGFVTAMDALARLDFEGKREVIETLRKERDKADEKMKDYFNAVRALRKVCTHAFENGHPAFKTVSENLEVCDICGYELRRN